MSPIFDRRISDQLRAAAMRGAEAAARNIMAASQQEVPEDRGDLKRSKFVTVQSDQVVLGYADGKATAAHENLRVSYRNGKKAKFLEQPLMAQEQAFHETVARAVRDETS